MYIYDDDIEAERMELNKSIVYGATSLTQWSITFTSSSME